MENRASEILKSHKLRNTPFRLKVLQLFLSSGHQALSNASLENALEDFDRITLYRTLKSFEKAGIIHQAIDGSSETKYAICHDDCSEHNHQDNHAHFLCNKCGNTYCIDNVVDTSYRLPKQFQLQKVHIALEGLCASCQN